MREKLTKAQREFLRLLREGPCGAVPSYRPGLALAARGYAKSTGSDWLIYRITPAGRAALEAGEHHE
jgi:hypothetical protein